MRLFINALARASHVPDAIRDTRIPTSRWHAACATAHISQPRQRRFSGEIEMIRKLKSGEYRLYSRKKDPRTGKRRNLGTFKTRAAAERHERAVQYFKHSG
jgi:hypothetical protein